MSYAGIIAYRWGWRDQDVLLVDCVRPMVNSLMDNGSIDFFWFDRFDARGPHIFFLLGANPRLCSRLSTAFSRQLKEYLRNYPSKDQVAYEEIEARHRECRGKTQCIIDRQLGYPSNDTVIAFRHPSFGYPFYLAPKQSAAERVWALVSSISLQALQELACRSEGQRNLAAISWIAALDRGLNAVTDCSLQFWRYYATTLLPALAEALQSDEPAVSARVRNIAGGKNEVVFSSVWENPASAQRWPQIPGLLSALELGRDEPHLNAWKLLREITHCLLKQLGIPVRLHVPLVLHAWRLHLPVGSE